MEQRRYGRDLGSVVSVYPPHCGSQRHRDFIGCERLQRSPTGQGWRSAGSGSSRLRKHLLIPFGRGLFTAPLLISPVAATATPFTNADYSVRVSAVTTPNQPQAIVARSQDQ